jgi:hypothetical protein
MLRSLVEERFLPNPAMSRQFMFIRSCSCTDRCQVGIAGAIYRNLKIKKRTPMVHHTRTPEVVRRLACPASS